MSNDTGIQLPRYTSVGLTAYMNIWEEEDDGDPFVLTFSSLESAVHEARRMIHDGFGYFEFSLCHGSAGAIMTIGLTATRLMETDSVGIYIAIVEGRGLRRTQTLRHGDSRKGPLRAFGGPEGVRTCPSPSEGPDSLHGPSGGLHGHPMVFGCLRKPSAPPGGMGGAPPE